MRRPWYRGMDFNDFAPYALPGDRIYVDLKNRVCEVFKKNGRSLVGKRKLDTTQAPSTIIVFVHPGLSADVGQHSSGEI